MMKELYIELFQKTILYTNGLSSEKSRDVIGEKLDVTIKLLEENEEEPTGETYVVEGYICMMLPKKTDKRYLTTLVHEAVHVSQILCHQLGATDVCTSDAGKELQAYLVDFIVRNLK